VPKYSFLDLGSERTYSKGNWKPVAKVVHNGKAAAASTSQIRNNHEQTIFYS
jgi:hypothetical protein